MFIAFKILVGIGLIIIIGKIIYMKFTKDEKPFFNLEALVVYFATGVGLVSVEMFLFSMLKIPFNIIFLIIPWGLLIIFERSRSFIPNRDSFLKYAKFISESKFSPSEGFFFRVDYTTYFTFSYK